jgi:hypothetical protein
VVAATKTDERGTRMPSKRDVVNLLKWDELVTADRPENGAP